MNRYLYLPIECAMTSAEGGYKSCEEIEQLEIQPASHLSFPIWWAEFRG